MSNGPPRRGGDEEGWCERMSNRATGSQHRRLTLLTLCVATFMISLDLTIVNVALPLMQRDMHLTAGDLEWVVSAYSLSLAALVPVGGALGDRYGRRLVFLTGMAVFALGSVACALSPSGAALIAFRGVQGVGGAAMLARTLSIITETFPSATRARAIGIWAAVGGTGFGAGPVAGGILLTYFGWASVFWVNVPVAVAGVVGTVVAIRESRAPQSRCLDVPGVMTSAAGLVAITLGLIESASYAWDAWPVAAPMVAGVGLLVGFAVWERHAPHAMLPTALLRSRSFVTASAIYLLSYLGLAGALFYVTLLYQDVDGWSVLRTGLSWLCMNAPFLLMAQSAGRLDRRFPATAVVATGCAVAAVGVFALSRVTTTTPFALTAVGYVLFGGGFGTFIPGTTHVALRDVPPGVSGAASGMLNAARQIGTSVGLAVLGAIGSTRRCPTGTAGPAGPSRRRHRPRTSAGDASRRSPRHSGRRTGTWRPSRSCTAINSPLASPRRASWPPRSSQSSHSGRHRVGGGDSGWCSRSAPMITRVFRCDTPSGSALDHGCYEWPDRLVVGLEDRGQRGEETSMEPRINKPLTLLPDTLAPVQALLKSAYSSGVPRATMELVHLRASQINGCAWCVVAGTEQASKAGETTERLASVVAWREAPYFDEAERSALALAEAATRLADRPDPVPDEVWDAAARHYDERQLAGIVLMVGMTNLFNRFNVATRQIAGTDPQ